MQTFSYQQARAMIAHAAARAYSRSELLRRLDLLDCDAAKCRDMSSLQLGYRLAWLLLPGTAQLCRAENPPVDCTAVLGRTDSRTAAQ